MSQLRKISKIIEPQFVLEGAGVRLLRSISPLASNRFDPFLLFDHFAFNDPTEGTNPGFPMHPHRGIETVTYILEGSVSHRDSLGNSGTIGPGDVQWMTSGGGILHEEMPNRGKNGEIFGFQLWVNLPAAQKMTRPRYQEISASTISCVEKNGAIVRIIAGEVLGVTGPVTEISAKPIYIDATLAPNAEFIQDIPFGHMAMAYVFEGNGTFGSHETISSIKMVQFGDGDHIHAQANNDSTLRFLLIAGASFNEPIFPYGPFVMSTAEEIQQALMDLRNGTFIRQ